ncbi:hypothetical protein GGX14DRAFT_400514 [Mycena pura]|uniref:Uncharacterized protein n=1 Tax=Mycena pura TaxID=153505 RepID=A0AAD6Y9B6_9AGAR|nr:hypothetical protein GGX14DRAFT_400514 [Mycena pura]
MKCHALPKARPYRRSSAITMGPWFNREEWDAPNWLPSLVTEILATYSLIPASAFLDFPYLQAERAAQVGRKLRSHGSRMDEMKDGMLAVSGYRARISGVAGTSRFVTLVFPRTSILDSWSLVPEAAPIVLDRQILTRKEGTERADGGKVKGARRGQRAGICRPPSLKMPVRCARYSHGQERRSRPIHGLHCRPAFSVGGRMFGRYFSQAEWQAECRQKSAEMA